MFFSPPVLQAPAADRREILPSDVNIGALYNAGLKISEGGTTPKQFGVKYMQISADYIQYSKKRARWTLVR